MIGRTNKMTKELEELCIWKEIMPREKAKNDNSRMYECDYCDGKNKKCPAYGVIGR